MTVNTKDNDSSKSEALGEAAWTGILIHVDIGRSLDRLLLRDEGKTKQKGRTRRCGEVFDSGNIIEQGCILRRLDSQSSVGVANSSEALPSPSSRGVKYYFVRVYILTT